jgi:hypothetical protein
VSAAVILEGSGAIKKDSDIQQRMARLLVHDAGTNASWRAQGPAIEVPSSFAWSFSFRLREKGLFMRGNVLALFVDVEGGYNS